MVKLLRILAVALLILSLLAVWLLLRKPSISTAEPGEEAVQSFDRKVDELAQAREQGLPAEIRLTEAEVNSKMAEFLRKNPPPAGTATLKGAAVRLEGEKLFAFLSVNVKGQDLHVTVVGHPDFQDHAVRLVPTEARIGSLPIPVSMLEGKVNMRFEVPENITGVRLENSELVVQSQ